jgi:hypothetical protein
MKRQIHILALVLFALTQFVAPFAHAHVDGFQGNSALHVSDVPHHLPSSGLSHCHIEPHVSQAIDLQQEYQRDDAAIIPASAISATPPPASDGATYLPTRYDPLHSTAYAYHRPHPQAPPA